MILKLGSVTGAVSVDSLSVGVLMAEFSLKERSSGVSTPEESEGTIEASSIADTSDVGIKITSVNKRLKR